MLTEEQRLFEKWVDDTNQPINLHKENDEYFYAQSQAAWAAWQASWRIME